MSESKQMLQTVRSEYQEIPGLRLTRPQIQRLWGLDSAVCEVVIKALTEARFLLFRDGHYVRADVAALSARANARPRLLSA